MGMLGVSWKQINCHLKVPVIFSLQKKKKKEEKANKDFYLRNYWRKWDLFWKLIIKIKIIAFW